MKELQKSVKKMLFLLLAGVLAGIGVFGGGASTSHAAAAENAYVYYSTGDVLYRVPAAGGSAQMITENFMGTDLESTSKYLYFIDGDSYSQLFRLSLTETEALASSFAGDKNILKYTIEGDFLYFMDEAGGIYRSPANAADDTQTKLIAKNADTDYPVLSVNNGRVYFNAIKDGANTWAASKSRDGSGNVQWIAKGAIPSDYYVHQNSTSIYVMVDTKPEETYYSTNCMILYTLPINGGNPKAVNAKSPLDANASLSGWWTNDYFIYNKGVTVDDDDHYDYSKSKAYAIDKAGKVFQFSQTSVTGLVDMGGNKIVYVGSNGKAYVSTIVNGKVATTKNIALGNVKNIYKLKNGTAAGQPLLYATGGAYALNTDLTLTKMEGVTWDNSVFDTDATGVYYVNANDNDALYKVSPNGKTNQKLIDGPVDYIEMVSAQ